MQSEGVIWFSPLRVVQHEKPSCYMGLMGQRYRWGVVEMGNRRGFCCGGEFVNYVNAGRYGWVGEGCAGIEGCIEMAIEGIGWGLGRLCCFRLGFQRVGSFDYVDDKRG